MIKKEIQCDHCEAEFYVETDADVLFCVSCGDTVDNTDDEPLYEDEELEDEYWEE
jgi:Fe2+ or Zn2+ uptake regulation protein